MKKEYVVIFERHNSISCETFVEAMQELCKSEVGEACFIIKGDEVLYHWCKPLQLAPLASYIQYIEPSYPLVTSMNSTIGYGV